MMGNIPFYVREFKAACMADAIRSADAALREDGVTVAVWKRSKTIKARAEKFSTNIYRKISNDQLPDAARRIAEVGYYGLFFNLISRRPEYTVPIFETKNSDSQLATPDEVVRKFVSTRIPIHGNPPLAEEDIRDIRRLFAKASGRIYFDLDAEILKIHQDNFSQPEVSLRGDLFDGYDVRMIGNLTGTPTRFFSNKDGDDEYKLPSGAMAFIFPGYMKERSAWHASNHSEGQCRTVYMLDLRVC